MTPETAPKLAVIGCGGMSQNFATAIEPTMKVVATVDIDADRAQAAAACFEDAEPMTDWREALAVADAGMLVLPHHLHHEVGMGFLEAGKHVLMEKPLANTPAECRELIEAAQANDVILMIGYVLRYHPLVRRFVDAVRSGEIGEVFSVSIWTEQYTRYPSGHWTCDQARLGGGQFFSHGCHYVDLLLAMLGEPVEGSHLGTTIGTPWMEGEGTSHVTMRFRNGALGYHFGTWGARGTRLRYAMHAHGTEGMLEADLSTGRLILHQDNYEGAPHEVGHRQMTGEGAQQRLLMEIEPGKHTANEVSHFRDCVVHGRQPLTDGAASLQGLQVIWKLYEAERAGVVADLSGLSLPTHDLKPTVQSANRAVTTNR